MSTPQAISRTKAADQEIPQSSTNLRKIDVLETLQMMKTSQMELRARVASINQRLEVEEEVVDINL